MTASGEIKVGHSASTVSSFAAPEPIAMPIKPPKALRVTASMRNWRMTSRRCAPMAMRMPISRVRSVTLAEEIHDLLLHDGQRLQTRGLDVDAAQAGLLADQLFDRRGIGHNDPVVLVRAAGRRSLRFEDTEDLERHVADADDFPDRVFVFIEQLFGGFLPDDRHLGRSAHVLLGENFAGRCVPLPDGE